MTDVPRYQLVSIARRLEIHAALALEHRTTRQEQAEAMQKAAEDLREMAMQPEPPQKAVATGRGTPNEEPTTYKPRPRKHAADPAGSEHPGGRQLQLQKEEPQP